MDTHVPVYKPRSRNVIQTILKNHFSDFEKHYDDHYADKYGKYRIIRIKQAVEKFIECGNYSKGIEESNAPTLNVGMSISVHWSLRSKRHVKAGIFAQAATKKGSYYYQSTYLKMCFLHCPTASLCFLCLKP